MTDHPSMIRNVALIGNLHHGKTTLIDMLVSQTHSVNWELDKDVIIIIIINEFKSNFYLKIRHVLIFFK